MNRLVAIDIETTPIDDVTKDIEKIWCICYAWRHEKEIITEEVTFPEGITKNDLCLKKGLTKEQLEQLMLIQQVLNNEGDFIPVFHSAQFEYRHLTESGFTIGTFHDTQVLGYVLNPGLKSFSLASWGERKYCDVKVHGKVDINEFFGTFKREIVERCLGDVASTLQLAEKLIPELRQDERAYGTYEQIDIPFIPCLVDMSRNGNHIDIEKLTEFTIHIEGLLESSKNKIDELVPAAPGKKVERVKAPNANQIAELNDDGKLGVDQIGKFIFIGMKMKLDKALGMERPYKVYKKIEPFNPASSNQKIWALFTYNNFISKETSDKTGKPTVDHYALEDAASEGSEIAECLLDFQKYNKLYTTYCIPLQNRRDENSRIYSNWNNTVTMTGRLSCDSPNFQTAPKRDEIGKNIRLCVTPQDETKVIVDIDLSGAEIRILAWYLVKLLGDKYDDAWLLWNAAQRGEDLHRPTIDQLGLDPDKERIVAKTLSFGDMYGMGKLKFARTLKCTKEKAEGYLKLRKLKMPSITALKELIWELCRTRPDHTIHTLYGRRLVYPDIVSKFGDKRARAERQVFNGLIQGTQGDIMKILIMRSMPFIHEAGAKLIAQVHDEMIMECPMGTADWLASNVSAVFTNDELLPGLPLVGEAKIGNSWGDLG